MTLPSPPTVARLVAPRFALASCVRAHVVRSTLDSGPLAPAERLNRFPASPFCAITWVLAGASELVVPVIPGAVAQAGQAVFNGPRTLPFMTANPGPFHGLTVLFFAESLHRLTGLDMAAQIDNIALLEDVLDSEWSALTAGVMAAADDTARIAFIEDWLEPRWRDVRTTASPALNSARDWVQGLAVRAAAAGTGRSARMAERRVRAWGGHPLRTLRRLARVEASLVDARDAQSAGKVSLSDVAARGGYAGQAHLSRDARALIGHSPAELVRLAQTDESYWLYRIWG